MAYVDEDVPLGGGRYLMEPMVIARLVQLTAIAAGERALVVGAGPGYGAALLTACGGRVTALEEDASLLAVARDALAELAPSVSLVSGPLAAGWPQAAPYDVILIEGGVPEIPKALGEQLHQQSGRLVAVCTGDNRLGHAVLAEATPAGLRSQPMFDCATPLIPQLRRSIGFVF
jgi:protein-L-isoaspartate(D-aspartate) O-methyltransferase